MGVVKNCFLGWIGIFFISYFFSTRLITGTILVSGITTLFIYDRIQRSFWKKQGIETKDGNVPIFGNLASFIDKNNYAWVPMHKTYQKFKNKRYVGTYLFWSPQFVILDAELAKLISIKDFDHFADRRKFEITTENDKYANEILTHTEGSHWKGVRSVLSPSFSSGKIKGMFPLVMEKANLLVKKIHNAYKNDESTIETYGSFGKFTIDVIATCAFGLEINCIENDAEFEEKLSEATNQGFKKAIAKTIILSFSQRLAESLGFSAMSQFKYFKEILVATIAQRRNASKRGDFVDLLLEAQATQAEPGSTKHDITEDTIIASAVVFLLAGYDTVKSALTITAHFLAKYPEEQARIRRELQDKMEEDGCLTYQNVMEAKYLEAFIMETQRLVPFAIATERRCTKDYAIPDTNVVIKKDQMVTIPIWSLQNDERYWTDPEKFNPDRFLPENKANIVSGSYLPFGIGPRNCIAQRFGMMEMKVVLARLVQEFELSLSPGREELGLRKGPLLKPQETMPLIFTPIVEE